LKASDALGLTEAADLFNPKAGAYG
jgi:hypothetical protein